MKKSILLVLIMVLNLLMPIAYAQSDVCFCITADKLSVSAGDEIKFKISAKDAKQIEKIQCTFEYDSDALEYKSSRFLISNTSMKKAVDRAAESKVGIVITLKSPFDGNADIAELTFKTKSAKRNPAYTLSNINCGAGTESLFDETTKPKIDIIDTTEPDFVLGIDKSFAAKGSAVKVEMKSNVEQLRGMQFTIDYPEDIFEIENCGFSAEAADNAMIAEFDRKTKTAVFVSDGNIQPKGVIFNFSIKVKDTADCGNYAINLKNIKWETDEKKFAADMISTENITVFNNFILTDLCIANGKITGNIYSAGIAIGAKMLVCFYNDNRFIGLKEKTLSGTEYKESFELSCVSDANGIKILIINDYESLTPLESFVSL